MTGRPSVHHVVYCVLPEHQDRAVELWRDLGFVFDEFVLDDVGLRVLLDWSGGVEVIAPVGRRAENEQAWAFLEDHGDGVYSVVVRVDDVEPGIAAARRHGSGTEFRQVRDDPGFHLEEVSLSPTLGMRLTLLDTDLPD